MPISDKLRRRFKCTFLTLLTAAAVLAVLAWGEQKRTAGEDYAVYSAYLSEGLLNDAHDWSVSGPIQVVVEDTTKVRGNLRLRVLYLLDGRIQFDKLRTSTRASFFVRNLLRTQLLPKFVLPSCATVVLASQSDTQSMLYGSPEFNKKFPHNMGFITLSGVGFNSARTPAP
jgi:hypothetical protein